MKDTAVLIISLISCFAALYADSIIPLGVAAGVLHVVSIVIVSFQSRVSYTILVAALGVASVLMVVMGFIESPPPGGSELWKVYFNRGLSILAIVAVAVPAVRVQLKQ